MYISSHYLDSYNWFVQVEDDTFVIIENLAYYLTVHNWSLPLMFGHAYDAWGVKYSVSGPGTVLSKAALRKLRGSLVKGQCGPSLLAGDVMLGNCLSQLGVSVSDSRDSLGRARFLMYQPESHLVPGSLAWLSNYWTHSVHRLKEVCVHR